MSQRGNPQILVSDLAPLSWKNWLNLEVTEVFISRINKFRLECKIISAPALQEYSRNYNNLIEKIKLWKRKGAKTFFYIISVRLDRSGVIMVSSMVSGNHWSCVHINSDGLYAESIGREVPLNFEDTFSNFFQGICKVYENNYDLIKSMQVAHEIQSIKIAHKYGYFCVKNFINQRIDMSVCGAAGIFFAITMSDFKKATEIIGQRKMTRYCPWMNDLESYSSFTRKVLIKWYIEGETHLSDIGLDRSEVKFS